MAPVLGYWKLRGLCEPIQLLLAHVGQEYEMKTYTIGPPPDFANDWFDTKFSLGLDFPNLPYYIDKDEGVKITQSIAILRYLGRKHGLVGKSEEENIKLDMIEQLAMDTMMNAVIIWYFSTDDNYEQRKSEMITKIKPRLLQLTQFLGDNQFIIGDRVTYADFMMYSYFDYNRLFVPEMYTDETAIHDYLARIESLPGVKEFISSENFSRFPIAAPMARFGGSKPSE